MARHAKPKHGKPRHAKQQRKVKAAQYCAAVCATAIALTPATAMANMNGIDVSNWQPTNITRTVPADFHVVKATEGTWYRSASWVAQIQGTYETGRVGGLYHYASGTSAIAEADYFVNTVGSYVGRSILVLDWESYGNRSWGNGNWVRQWVNRVHDRTSVWPVVYVQASAVSQIPSDVRAHCMLWKAQYANTLPTGYQSRPWNAGSAGEGMLQYTSTGRLPGYAGNLDLDLFFGDRKAWGRIACGERKGCVAGSFAATGTPVRPVSTPSTKPNADINQLATDVINGKYGNGSTRRAMLGGYYDAVMRVVNQRLGCGTSRQQTACVVVRRGDTLSTIAARNGGTWRDYTGYRSGNPNVIYAGEAVCRRSGYTGQTVAYSRRHVVRSGDTLSRIAAAHGVSLSSIHGYRSGNPNIIYPGEVLYW